MKQQVILTVLFVTAALVLMGCSPPADSGSVPANSNTNLSTNQVVSQPTEPDYSSVIVTIPLIDALMSDETFRERARSEVQLTDEEIDKLWDATRDSTLKLGEERSAEEMSSTTASSQQAEKTVREALGTDKGNRFLELVRREVGGRDPGALANSQPNSVPNDTRIVINAPAYRMDLFENGELKKSFKVGIGYPEFPLPTGLRRANELLFNPTWTPPDEPWVKGNVKAGKTVEAGSKNNPLGIVKIPIGLPSLIHAGKSADRLGTFASHGCVGLTNGQAREFSLLLASLGGAELTEEDIAGFQKNQDETKSIKLERDIPVELRYETIIVQDGTLRIMRDVYERGTNTEENLRRVLQAFDVSLDNLSADMRERILDGLEKMAVDATGDPVEEGSSNTNKNSNSNSKSNSSRVTRNIKGDKEVTFELAELRGKGYPAPTDAKF